MTGDFLPLGARSALGLSCARHFSKDGILTRSAKLALKQLSPTAHSNLGTLPPGVGLGVGSRMPDVSLSAPDASRVQLASLLKSSGVVVVFYRGGWCPYCNFQVRELTLEADAFYQRAMTPVAISVDRIDETEKSQAEYEIPFPILSDPELVAHEAFRVVQQVTQADIDRLRAKNMDLELSSGKTHHKIAIPAVFIVDRSGMVRWAHADLNYKVRPTALQLLGAIDGLASD